MHRPRILWNTTRRSGAASSPAIPETPPRLSAAGEFDRRALLAGIAASGLSACATIAPPPPFDAAHVDHVLRGLVARGELVGVSALVWQRDTERYFGAFGLADREADRPMARDTLVQIWSMTKPVTGVALMTLWEEGRFQLDDPIAEYLPELAALRVYAGDDASGAPILVSPDRPPTIRDLTRHTAGLTPRDGQSYVDRVYAREDPMNRANPLAEVMRRLARVPLHYQPGTRWAYSDAVDVQAALVERLSGRPFDAFVKERIFDPLQMHQTGFYVSPERALRLAATYDRAEDGVFTRHRGARTIVTDRHVKPRGGFGLVSTLDDYMRFARMLLHDGDLYGSRILKRPTARLMHADQLPEGLTDKHFLPGKGQVGFGIDLAVRIAPPASDEENFGVVGEYFWDGLASTLFWCDPENDLAAVLFVQMLPFDRMHLHRTFRRAVYEAVGVLPRTSDRVS
ncbi:MAG: beta-lactamase family protein [Hyphomonadaceae bacterium]|nr:beta-lactamase family protein [Hyphomonadaceae bacterium]